MPLDVLGCTRATLTEPASQIVRATIRFCNNNVITSFDHGILNFNSNSTYNYKSKYTSSYDLFAAATPTSRTNSFGTKRSQTRQDKRFTDPLIRSTNHNRLPLRQE